jgi:hypothetical protein
MRIFSIVVFWLVCGILHMGFNYSYFQCRYKELAKRDFIIDSRAAILTSLLGPAAIIATITLGNYK